MVQQLVLSDRVNARPPVQAVVLQWQEGVVLTPRLLISERVRIEWHAGQDRQASHDDRPAPLVEIGGRPNPVQSAPAWVDIETGTPLSLDTVTAMALEGFTRNAFFLIVDGRQITDLDEALPLRPTSEVTFIRLVQLKGG